MIRKLFLISTGGLMAVVMLACTTLSTQQVRSPETTTTTPVGEGFTPTATSRLTPLAAATKTPSPDPGNTELAGQGNADVLYVRTVQAADGSWTFTVTVQHPDTGWEDYANGWDVVTPAGLVLKPDPGAQFTRTLLHPHENEQPFTRSQSRITIPEGVTQLLVRAHDLVDGYGGQEVLLDLNRARGDAYEVVFAAEE